MPSRVPTPSSQAGFTLIESMVALLVLITGLLATFALVDVSKSRAAGTRAREAATNLARHMNEAARGIPFRELTPETVEAKLKELPGLADAQPDVAGWQIRRRNFTYTVVPAVCTVDDTKDGLGDHAGTTFCPDTPPPGTADARPEDFRRLSVAVAWPENGVVRRTTLASTVSSNGQAVGLPVSDLRLTTPASDAPGTATEPVISQVGTTSLTFTATAPAEAKSLIWTLDGQTMTPVAVQSTSDRTKWTFNWAIPASVTDGSYQIGAQAVDGQNTVGPERTITVRLIRTAPVAVTGLASGYNTVLVSGATRQVVELEWFANSERSVTGYRVFNSSGSVVCSIAAGPEPACIDYAPPAMTATNRTYTVRPVYRDAAGTEQLGGTATTVPAQQGTPGGATAQTYGFKTTTAETGTNCTGTKRHDMVAGYTGAVTATRWSGPSIAFCTPTFRAGEYLPPQTITVKASWAYTGSTHQTKGGCHVSVGLTKNGTGGVLSAPAILIKSAGEQTWSFSLGSTVTFAAGDRLVAAFTWDTADADCAGTFTTMSYGGTGTQLGSLRVTANLLATYSVQPPAAPTNLTAVTQADGTVRLRWTAPAGGADSYRIYRGGKDVTQRLDRTGSGTEVEYIDTPPPGTPVYHVTAVNTSLTESAFLGPVSP